MGKCRTNRLRKRISELAACELCRPYSGLWRWNDELESVDRCTCPKGRLLAKADRINHSAPSPAAPLRFSFYE